MVVFFFDTQNTERKKNDRRFNRSSFYTETKYAINPNNTHTSNSSNLRQKKEGGGGENLANRKATSLKQF